MTVSSLEGYLAEHPLLRGLAEDDLELLTGCASNVAFQADEEIFRQGQAANHCYLIRYGRVALQVASPNRGPLTVQTLEPGEVLGWSWLFPPYRWHFDARALELTRATALDGSCLREKCDQDPRLGYELMKRFSAVMHDRMQASRLQLLDLYGPSGGSSPGTPHAASS